jgi:hypothetical protein
MALWGEYRSLKRWGLVGNLQVTESTPLKRIVGPQPLLLPGHEVRGSAPPHCSHNNMLPCYRSKSNRGQSTMPETSKLKSQNKLSLFVSWLSQIVCYSNEKLTNTPPVLITFRVVVTKHLKKIT